MIYNFFTDGRSEFYDIIYIVNHEIQPDARNVMEGSTLIVMFQLFNSYCARCFSPDCETIEASSEGQIICTFESSYQCLNVKPCQTVILTFRPIKLSDNGTNIIFGFQGDALIKLDPIPVTGEYTHIICGHVIQARIAFHNIVMHAVNCYILVNATLFFYKFHMIMSVLFKFYNFIPEGNLICTSAPENKNLMNQVWGLVVYKPPKVHHSLVHKTIKIV